MYYIITFSIERVWATPNKQKDTSGCGWKFSFYGSVNTLPMLARKPFQKLGIQGSQLIKTCIVR